MAWTIRLPAKTFTTFPTVGQCCGGLADLQSRCVIKIHYKIFIFFIFFKRILVLQKMRKQQCCIIIVLKGEEKRVYRRNKEETDAIGGKKYRTNQLFNSIFLTEDLVRSLCCVPSIRLQIMLNHTKPIKFSSMPLIWKW